ncbi:DUF6476 family protein [Pararhodobacter marinus]|uniref:DUF6476 family protein n=1 Tax=Pararhodobacter marinus TaxID=2184063 RepID=UPI00269EB751
MDLRFLKILVTTLTVVMILGLLTIVGLLVTRLGGPAPLPALPDSVILPEGAAPAAVTFARDWLVVVTEDGEILLYRPEGGAPFSTTALP